MTQSIPGICSEETLGTILNKVDLDKIRRAIRKAETVPEGIRFRETDNMYGWYKKNEKSVCIIPDIFPEGTDRKDVFCHMIEKYCRLSPGTIPRGIDDPEIIMDSICGGSYVDIFDEKLIIGSKKGIEDKIQTFRMFNEVNRGQGLTAFPISFWRIFEYFMETALESYLEEIPG